jgi:Spy/CpxP family protein refolding chaperone
MLLILLMTVSLAQAPPAERPGRGERPALTNGELVNMLDTYAIVRAQDALQLADAQYGQFVTRLKRLQQIRRRNTQARHQIVQELRRLTQAPAADEQALRARLKALSDHEVAAAEELRRAYAAVDEVLDARQQARFRIFEEQMERRKLDLLMRARTRAAAPGPQPRR